MGMGRKGKPEVGKCRFFSSNDTDSFASIGTQTSTFDWLNESTHNCFKDEDYIHDTEVMRLHIAARENHTNSIKRSLEKGVSVHLPDAVGRSALHWAAVFCKHDTVEAMVKLFPVSRLDRGDRKGCTPLHYAVLAGRADVSNMLLKAGCCIHSTDNQGRTPLHYAAQNANAAVVLLLLKRGADPSHLDKLKRSPYDVAKDYNNTNKILECLRFGTSKTPPAHEKPTPVEPRHKQPTITTKAVETDGKVSLTFLSVNNVETEQRQQGWRPYVPQTEDEEVITDTPVEIVKEEMEKDAERMKYKLRKIEMRKEPPSEEKLKEQERALHLLLDRSKQNALEERRKRFAEDERFRLLTQNRTRSATPKTCSIPPSSVGLRTPSESIMGPYQTSHRPSNASSPKRETEELAPEAEDEWREETCTPSKLDRMNVYPHTPPPAELQTNNECAEESTERQAAGNNLENADAALSDNQEPASVTEDGAEPDNEQERANPSATYFPANVHQWLTTAFSFPAAPHVSSLGNHFVPTCIPDSSAGSPTAPSPSPPPPPPPQEEQGNITRSSSPSPLFVDYDYFTAPSEVPGPDVGQTHLFSPPSALSTSSYKSPASPHWDASSPISPQSMQITPGYSTGRCSPQPRKMEQHVKRTADTSAPDYTEKETDVRPEHQDEHTPVKHKDPGSHDEDEDPFTRLGYTHSFKFPKIIVDTPPNRHGLECFSRPKARSCKVRTREDHRGQYNHSPSKHPWAPDEPWRPGGISKTVEHFKMYELLKAKGKSSSLHLIRTLRTMMQSKHVDYEDVDSDPFFEVNPQEDEDIDVLPLAKVIRQQEALWSLREASHQSPNCPCSPISKARSTHTKQDDRIISSPRTNNLSFESIPQTNTPRHPAEVATRTPACLTTRIEQGEGMLIAQMTDEQCPQPCTDEASHHSQLASFAYATPPQPSRTIPSHPGSSLQPSRTGQKYALFVQQERQQVQPTQSSSSQPQRESCPPSTSTQQQPVFSYSTSSPLPKANFVNRTKPCPTIPTNHMNLEMLDTWPQQNSGYTSVDESQSVSYRRDELENIPKTSSPVPSAYEESEIRRNQQRDGGGKFVSPYPLRRVNSRCSLSRISSERLAPVEYYGQSVRPRFLGIRRGQPPVHQCIDVESLSRQWL